MNVVVKINELERLTLDDTVITAYWEASLTDGEITESISDSKTFTRNDESPEFIPFADLTESDVIGWIGFDMEGLEAVLGERIEKIKNPPKALGLPW